MKVRVNKTLKSGKNVYPTGHVHDEETMGELPDCLKEEMEENRGYISDITPTPKTSKTKEVETPKDVEEVETPQKTKEVEVEKVKKVKKIKKGGKITNTKKIKKGGVK